MNDECVDLIYLDPPFNKNKTFEAPINSTARGAAFEDIWEEKLIKDEWVEQIRGEDDLKDYLESVKEFSRISNYCYLVYMAIRILEMKRVLKNRGSLYFHCDHTMSHYIKILLDTIFDKDGGGYRNEIIWHHPKIGLASKKWTSNTDTIFFYTKSDEYFYKRVHGDEPNELYNRWKRKLRAGKLYYREAKTINDSPAKSKCRQLEKKLGRPLKDDDVVVDFNLPENKKVLDNCWKISFVKGNSKEATGYPTQKPLALMENIIEASSKEGDVVLDPFCGCATTCVAAEKLGRDWVGIDISKKAHDLVCERLEKEVWPKGTRDWIVSEPNFETDPPIRSENIILPKGWVYVAASQVYKPNEFKVGISQKDPERRVNHSNTYMPPGKELEVVFKNLTPHFREIEKHIHEKFGTDREFVNAELTTLEKEIRSYRPSIAALI